MRFSLPRTASSLRVLGLAVSAGACAAASVATLAACLTAPPPDLPQQPLHRPTIRHDAVVPPSDQVLSELPGEFIVPIELDDPNASFSYDVFVDYDAVHDPTPIIYPQARQASPAALDGGVMLVPFTLDRTSSTLDPSSCHVIEFLVAHAFNPSAPHTPDAVGGDIVSWRYNPGGGTNGCPVYDAGSLQDGAFPEATTDGLPAVPESGGGP